MTDHLAHTVIPWILGVLSILVTVSGLLTIKFWRESKRSPYYFLRRQAEQNMQTYSLATLGLFITSVFVATYAWQGPQENYSRVALMANAKPVEVVEEVVVSVEQETAVEEVTSQVLVIQGANQAEILLSLADQQGNDVLQLESDGVVADTPNSLEAAESEEAAVVIQAPETLPAEFNQYEPSIQLADNTYIGSLSFSTEVDDELNAIDPRRLFEEGFFTLYATFEYGSMADGMEWSWVWRRDGEVISGGNELWVYGDEGPGYVYLNPQEGFKAGQYTVQIWVNDELMTQSNMFITTDVALNN